MLPKMLPNLSHYELRSTLVAEDRTLDGMFFVRNWTWRLTLSRMILFVVFIATLGLTAIRVQLRLKRMDY